MPNDTFIAKTGITVTDEYVVESDQKGYPRMVRRVRVYVGEDTLKQMRDSDKPLD